MESPFRGVSPQDGETMPRDFRSHKTARAHTAIDRDVPLLSPGNAGDHRTCDNPPAAVDPCGFSRESRTCLRLTSDRPPVHLKEESAA
jgi:hypothetical protein